MATFADSALAPLWPVHVSLHVLVYVQQGEVAERFKAAVLKTVDSQGSGGSNPSLSATLWDVDCREPRQYCIHQMQKMIKSGAKYCLELYLSYSYNTLFINNIVYI